MMTAHPEIENWVCGVRPEIHASRAAQIDINELLDPAPSMAVAEALACAETMRDVIRHWGLDIDVVLAIPLPASIELIRDHPEVGAMIDAEWQYGPGLEVPGFYLIPPALWRTYEACEDYRHSIPTPSVPTGFAAYYRTWRTIEDEARGWEYARAIYIRTV